MGLKREDDFMNIEQFVMAYQVEQDRLRAMMPEGFESLRPVLRINAEIREESKAETIYLELNTPVAAFHKRGWLTIASWESPATAISYVRDGKAVSFLLPHLEITYTGVGIEGGCPAESDNDGCFSIGEQVGFKPTEAIGTHKEFCDCAFRWKFAEGNAHGMCVGGKSVPAFPTKPVTEYEKQALSAQIAAAIGCKQILGAYVVKFERWNPSLYYLC